MTNAPRYWKPATKIHHSTRRSPSISPSLRSPLLRSAGGHGAPFKLATVLPPSLMQGSRAAVSGCSRSWRFLAGQLVRFLRAAPRSLFPEGQLPSKVFHKVVSKVLFGGLTADLDVAALPILCAELPIFRIMIGSPLPIFRGDAGKCVMSRASPIAFLCQPALCP